MYMNPYQEYIRDLLSEYGALLKRQLMKMINFKFRTQKSSIDGYIYQMCRYADYEVIAVGADDAVCQKGTQPDYDVIRSFDVLLAFMPKVQYHRKCRGFISIVFIIEMDEYDKEVSVIPVKAGHEKAVSSFANDKFDNGNCEIVIFLLENKVQLKLVQTGCNHKFAVVEQSGVKFIKHNIQNN